MDRLHRPERFLLDHHDDQGSGDVPPGRAWHRAGPGGRHGGFHAARRGVLGELPRLQPRHPGRGHRCPHLLPAGRPARALLPRHRGADRKAAPPTEDSIMSTTILVTDRVSRRFGGIQAVDDVSFALKQGEIVALIGPNGAGKTTLVNLMTGVHRPTEGHIRFQDQDVTGQRPFQAARRGIARTFQIVQPFPRMSVLENVAAGALFGGARPSVADAKAIAREQLEFMGLASMADRPASALTLAGRKRLELAKSMAMQPKLLMLDEVNAGLNASEIDGALRIIRQIADRGVTILVIEHLMKVVLSLAARVLVLHHGQLIAEGETREIVKDKRVIEAYLGAKFARRVAAEVAGG